MSRTWGLERGNPIDRYYMEKFFARYESDIKGSVLEIGDDRYTRQFGKGRVVKSDILHYEEGNRIATIIGDLTNAPSIDSDRFDCVICVQTLQYIYDLGAALRTLYRIVKPGGVLLATVPGITSMGDGRWMDHWCWSMTPVSARLLFRECFGETAVNIEQFGNVLSATSYLQGLAAEELYPEELDHIDLAYPLIVAVRAEKQAPSTI